MGEFGKVADRKVSECKGLQTGEMLSFIDEKLMIAIEKSLEPQKVVCQFCLMEVDSMDKLHILRLNCQVINESERALVTKTNIPSESSQFLSPTQNRSTDEFTGIGNPVVFSPTVK